MMRNSTRLILAATVLLAAPAAAQETGNAAATNDATVTASPELGTTNNLDSDAAIATGTTNGLTAGPGAAPMTAEPIDPSYAQPDRPRDDDRFPWGLLGLLGLAGLIPRKPAPRRHDGAI
jgi:hypothetical protein